MSLDVTTLALAKSYTNQHGGSGTSVPKPLTYDYMPEGYPRKSVQTTTLMEEQQVAFTLSGEEAYLAQITNAFKVVEGQTYTVNWDGAEYECVGVVLNSMTLLGNLSIVDEGSDTGEPFVYGYNTKRHSGLFGTLDTSASHTISVKTTVETVTPMAEEFLPAGVGGGGSGGGSGGVTTLHINVTAVNAETMEATFTADKTPLEMQQASAIGPTWCVVSFAAGILSEEAVSIGLPPAWLGGQPAFGLAIFPVHEGDGNNKIVYAVWQRYADTWGLNLIAFGS